MEDRLREEYVNGTGDVIKLIQEDYPSIYEQLPRYMQGWSDLAGDYDIRGDIRRFTALNILNMIRKVYGNYHNKDRTTMFLGFDKLKKEIMDKYRLHKKELKEDGIVI